MAKVWPGARLDRLMIGSRGARCSGVWTGRLRRKGSRDELACPASGQTNFGGQRMSGPQRRPARRACGRRAFPELGPVMRWPGVPAHCLRRLSRGFAQRCVRSVGAGRRGGSSSALCNVGGAVGVSRSRGRPVAERSGAVKSRRVRRLGAGQVPGVGAVGASRTGEPATPSGRVKRPASATHGSCPAGELTSVCRAAISAPGAGAGRGRRKRGG